MSEACARSCEEPSSDGHIPRGCTIPACLQRWKAEMGQSLEVPGPGVNNGERETLSHTN